jgi:hypothetical protein
MENIFYLGVYAQFSEDSINDINNYELLLKVKKIDIKIIEVIDTLHIHNNFYQLNFDTFYSYLKSETIMPKTIIEFEDENLERIIKLSDLFGKYHIYTISTPLYFSYKNTKSIILENLDKIKETIIKNNKILSE